MLEVRALPSEPQRPFLAGGESVRIQGAGFPFGPRVDLPLDQVDQALAFRLRLR